MKFTRRSLLLSLGFFLLSFKCFGGSFETEDSLYSKRGLGFSYATKAREAYKARLTDSLTSDEKIYVVSQMARLDIYRGAMTDGVSLEAQKKVFQECVDTVNLIKESKSQEFYYFHISCVAFRGKLSSAVGRIKWAFMLKNAQKAALESVKEGVGYEGGGILRVLSAVRGNRKAKPLGLYDPLEALEFSQKALATPSINIPPYPLPLSGKDYHENYYYVGQAQMALGVEENNKEKVKKGLEIIEQAIIRLDELDDLDELPRGREPETNYYRGLMATMKTKATKCLVEQTWKTCLIEALS